MTGIVAHTYPEWWLKLTGQVAHWSTDYSPSIINKNMQSGNYKRAVKYYLFTNSLMVDFEKNNKEIKKIITTYILKD